MNKKVLTIAITCFSCLLLITSFAVADKPEWAGKGKGAKEERNSHKKEIKNDDASDSEDSGRQKKDKLKKEKKKEKVKKGETSKGLEKQKDKKSLQEQKELDKGSEKGQESRQKRKKWWKFWE